MCKSVALPTQQLDPGIQEKVDNFTQATEAQHKT